MQEGGSSTHSALETKANVVLSSWLSMEQHMQQKKAHYPRITEQAGPLAIAINLAHIPITTVSELFKNSPDEMKTHPGVRATFFIVKFLYPGWSSVAVAGDGKDGLVSNAMSNAGKNKGSQKRGNGKDANEVKEKLSSSFGDSVIMHSFNLVNQRGTYVRSGKSEECLVLSPGMLLSTKIWGNKFDKTFKEQSTDIDMFDMVLIQFGMHSIGSSSKDNGMMLEIKSYCQMPTLNPSAMSILSSGIVPTNMQECSIMRSRYTDASHIMDSKQFQNSQTASTSVEGQEQQQQQHCIKGLYQEMLRGNISTSCFFLKLVPTQANGVFAIGPDDNLKFYVNHPLADIPNSSSLNVYFNASDFIYKNGNDQQNVQIGTSATFREWVTKLLNVLMLLGAVELFVIVDTYKKSKSDGQEAGSAGENTSNLIMDAYVRVNANIVTEKLLSSKPMPAMAFPFVMQSFSNQNTSSMLQHLMVYPCSIINNTNSYLHIAVDTRKMTKKKNAKEVITQNVDLMQPHASKMVTHSTSFVYADSDWDRAHGIYLFFEERLVHYFVVPISPIGTGADSSRMVLETISIPSQLMSIDAVEYDSDSAKDNTKISHSDSEFSMSNEASPLPPPPYEEPQQNHTSTIETNGAEANNKSNKKAKRQALTTS